MPTTTSLVSTGGSGGIEVRNLSADLAGRLFDNTGQRAKVSLRPGANAIAVLYVAADVVNGDTVTIGADVFEVDIINTDAGVNTVGAMSATADPVLVTLSAAPATAILAGAILRVENEMVKVLRKLSTTAYVVARGRCGTTKASHVNDSDVYVSDAAPAANIPVGLVGTLTPAVFGPALVDEFMNALPADNSERATTLASTLYGTFTAQALAAGQQIVFTAVLPGVNATATTETFTNATDNVWGAATFTGGLASGILSSEAVTRVPTAAEELVGVMHFALPFTVRAAIVFMTITATGQVVQFTGEVDIAYSESTDVVMPGTTVTLRNVGAASTAYITGFAVTNTVTVIAYE